MKKTLKYCVTKLFKQGNEMRQKEEKHNGTLTLAKFDGVHISMLFY